MKTKSTNRYFLAAMLVASVFAAGCESDEAKSWRELKEAQEAQDAQAKVKAAAGPAYKDPECIRQNESRMREEITWAQMSERCSMGFNGPRSAPGGS